MSRINGEKARANVTKKRRTAQRMKDRARLAEIKAGSGATASEAPKAETTKK